MAERGEHAPGRILREAGEGGTSARRERQRPPLEGQDGGLAPFQPPPPALIAPPTPAAAPPASGSAAAHAEAAALAERLVTSMRVGRVGRDGHEVRMRLSLRGDAGLEVRLRHEGDRLTAVLVGDRGQRGETARIAEALERELSERGVTLASISVE